MINDISEYIDNGLVYDINQDNIEDLEIQFLSTIVNYQNFSFDYLQLEPKHLTKPIHKELLKYMIDNYSKYEVTDYYLILIDFIKLKDNEKDRNELYKIVYNDLSPVHSKKQYFMAMQSILFDNYKKRAILYFSNKLQNREISVTQYLSNMNLINDMNLKIKSTLITVKELEDNINSNNTLIELKHFKKLNEVLKLSQGDYLTIGAGTGAGKSGLLLNLMNDLMDRYQCIYFNMEMNKSTIYQRIVSIASDIPINYVVRPETEYQEQNISATMKYIENNNIIIEHNATTLNEIRSIIAKYKNADKHTIIFLDHIGLIRSNEKKSLYEQTTEIAKSLRQICLKYNCTIIAASQLNRTSYNSDEPSISMLKDSGELENSSSKVIMLYKDKNQDTKNDLYTNDMIIDIVKNRNGLCGRIPLKYYKSKQIFKEKENYEGGTNE